MGLESYQISRLQYVELNYRMSNIEESLNNELSHEFWMIGYQLIVHKYAKKNKFVVFDPYQ